MSRHDDDAVWKAITVLALIPAVMVVQGWCLSLMWGWFLVPLGIPAVGVAQAIGIGIAVRMVVPDGPEKKANGLATAAAQALAVPFLLTTMGYLIHLAM